MDSDKTNRIAQMNGSHASYNVIVIPIFNVKIVYAIFPRVFHCIFNFFMRFDGVFCKFLAKIGRFYEIARDPSLVNSDLKVLLN